MVGGTAPGAYNPALSHFFHSVCHGAIRLHEIGDGLVVICSHQASCLAEVPAGHSYGAAVMGEVAINGDAMWVLDEDHVCHSLDDCAFNFKRHLRISSVQHNLAVREYFHLFTIAEHSDALLADFTALCVVVDNNTEVAVDEVLGQQIAALSRELIELLVESHEMLIASKGSMG